MRDVILSRVTGENKYRIKYDKRRNITEAKKMEMLRKTDIVKEQKKIVTPTSNRRGSEFFNFSKKHESLSLKLIPG